MQTSFHTVLWPRICSPLQRAAAAVQAAALEVVAPTSSVRMRRRVQRASIMTKCLLV